MCEVVVADATLLEKEEEEPERPSGVVELRPGAEVFPPGVCSDSLVP